VLEHRPAQATLVPVTPGEMTSDHGFRFADDRASLEPVVSRLKEAGIRVAAFVDPWAEDLEIAREIGLDRIEIYTGPFAMAYAEGGEAGAERDWAMIRRTAERAQAAGLGINAGHDLDLNNLGLMRQLEGLEEVSIGHALIADALEVGLEAAVKAYLSAIRTEAGAAG
jgi:pyridoxine 5-phosphate synthase